MVGQKQVSLFSHVETTGGMGKAHIPVGESSNFRDILCFLRTSQCIRATYVGQMERIKCSRKHRIRAALEAERSLLLEKHHTFMLLKPQR